jgi:hypothetical protein
LIPAEQAPVSAPRPHATCAGAGSFVDNRQPDVYAVDKN